MEVKFLRLSSALLAALGLIAGTTGADAAPKRSLRAQPRLDEPTPRASMEASGAASAPKKQESTAEGLSTLGSSPDPQNNAGEQVTYRFVGNRATVPYSVVIRKPDAPSDIVASCATPCTRQLSPGPVSLTVLGPGRKRFSTELVLPEQMTQVRVQHFTLNRVIAGSVLLALGLALTASSSIGLATSVTGWGRENVPEPLLSKRRDPRDAYFDVPLFSLSTVGLIHGATFLFTGIGLLGAIRLNGASTEPILGMPSTFEKPRATSLSLQITPDQRGVTASISGTM